MKRMTFLPGVIFIYPEDVKKMFFCSLCDMYFVSKESIKKHLSERNHLGFRIRYVLMRKCREDFSLPEFLMDENEEVEDEKKREEDVCGICLDYMDRKKRLLVQTMCNHEFHQGCLREYQFSSSVPDRVGLMCYKCPMCRNVEYVYEKIKVRV